MLGGLTIQGRILSGLRFLSETVKQLQIPLATNRSLLFRKVITQELLNECKGDLFLVDCEIDPSTQTYTRGRLIVLCCSVYRPSTQRVEMVSISRLQKMRKVSVTALVLGPQGIESSFSAFECTKEKSLGLLLTWSVIFTDYRNVRLGSQCFINACSPIVILADERRSVYFSSDIAQVAKLCGLPNPIVYLRKGD